MSAVTLIVMEPGSEWPGHIGGSEDLVVLGSQTDGLHDKTRQRVELLRQRGERVRVGVLACSDALDATSVTRRSDVARELLGALPADGFGRLVLSTAQHAAAPLRCELLALAGTLSHEVRSTTVTVSVRFGCAAVPVPSPGGGPSIASARPSRTRQRGLAAQRQPRAAIV